MNLMLARLEENRSKVSRFDRSISVLSLRLASHRISPKTSRDSTLIADLDETYEQLHKLVDAVPPRPSNSHSLLQAVTRLLYILKEHLYYSMWRPDGQIKR